MEIFRRLFDPSTPRRYIGSPITGGNTPARCGRVQQNQIVLGNLVGTGGFGSVYKASVQGRTVAVKIYHKRHNSRALQQSYNSELLAYRMGFKHRNLVSVLGATSLRGFVDDAWIVMDYVGQHSLQTVLNDPRQDLDTPNTLSLALQMARGLQYLHSLNVVHMDLKPANCLLSPDLTLRIADFGCCQLLPPPKLNLGQEEEREDEKKDEDVNEKMKKKKGGRREGETEDRRGVGAAAAAAATAATSSSEAAAIVAADPTTIATGVGSPAWRNERAGTLAYRAPELLKGLRPCPGSDVYSLGITLWQMHSRQGPYEGLPAHAMVYQVVTRNLRPNHHHHRHHGQIGDDSDNVDKNDDSDPFEVIFSDLYTQCWAGARDERPTSLEVTHALGLWLEHM